MSRLWKSPACPSAYAAEYAPELMTEVEGVAEGAGLTVDQVMLVNVRNQVPAAIDGACTGVVVEPERAESGTGMAGQNWDNDPAMDPFSVVLIRRPTRCAGTHEFHSARRNRLHGPE